MAFDWGVIAKYAPDILANGLVLTLKITVISAVLAILLGTVLAAMRLSSIKLVRWTAASYVNIFRAIPILMVLFWMFFLVPYVIGFLNFYWSKWVHGIDLGMITPVALDGFICAVVTFTLFEAAYFCEIMRAGINAIPKGQPAAGYALGLRYHQVMLQIVLPQAFRNMLPVLFTQVIVLFQDTSLVAALSLRDLLGLSRIVADNTGNQVELYIFAAVVFFIVSFIGSMIVRYLDKRMAIIR
ncbi:amino acid ABC transporter permease [Basilea psittacipulmonis DSM 24701]|uniref:Glutamate/aspartate import permease protein GltK n=1 Tax=Basilea psittacipulmonis DSM 24701 TaxID=1072685 RepID=A0A077DEM3_9BURK|nr:amino acid ABC transporter permease [Basilea psittacipulmonis DSM 24701]